MSILSEAAQVPKVNLVVQRLAVHRISVWSVAHWATSPTWKLFPYPRSLLWLHLRSKQRQLSSVHWNCQSMHQVANFLPYQPSHQLFSNQKERIVLTVHHHSLIFHLPFLRPFLLLTLTAGPYLHQYQFTFLRLSLANLFPFAETPLSRMRSQPITRPVSRCILRLQLIRRRSILTKALLYQKSDPQFPSRQHLHYHRLFSLISIMGSQRVPSPAPQRL